MMLLSESLLNRPVMSLRTGGKIALAQTPIINPDNLKIEGFYCEDSFSKQQLILVSQDIRDQIKQGFVVNDHDVLVEAEDLIRLKDVLEIDFQLLNKTVVTKEKKRIGKVVDFAVDSETLYVQKLYVGQSLLKNLHSGQLSVDRNQILEITDKNIIIKDPLQHTPLRIPLTKPAVTS
ncbi:hypothetical protein BH23PAT2_BH23PAT2_02870 [soil metagenome]